MRKLLPLISLLLISISSFAAENINYVCTLNNSERQIEVAYLEKDQSVPCEVRYTKEGNTDVLWTYSNEIDQCEQHAEAFVAKQESFGWQCSKAVTAEVAE